MAHRACLDLIKRVHVTPLLTRAFWSADRAWPGGKVRLHAESRFVPDGTSVRFEVRPVDPEIDVVLAELDATAGVEDSKCVVEHTLEWDDTLLDAVLDATSNHRFCFVATVERYALSLRSGPLFVPFAV